MSKPKNAFEIFRFLDKSNCGECGQNRCLAFAGAVFLGQRRIRDGPNLSREALERFAGELGTTSSYEPDPGDRLEKLMSEAVHLDLAKAPVRVGPMLSGRKLTLKVFGKDFSVDEKGNLAKDIHINPWVAVPFLSYILYGQELPVAGKWVPFRE